MFGSTMHGKGKQNTVPVPRCSLGKIVVGGQDSGDLALCRFNANGSQDNSFASVNKHPQLTLWEEYRFARHYRFAPRLSYNVNRNGHTWN